MNIWLVTVGEPLPLLGERCRLWRCGLLAKALSSRGHAVKWWTSTFDHIRKQPFPGARFSDGPGQTVLDGVILQWLRGASYQRNISVWRLVNHAQIALQFRRLAMSEQTRPDVIVVSFPTIELSYVAHTLSRRWGCAVIVDIRDLWPDIFVDAVPSLMRPAARFLLWPYFAMTRALLKAADSVVAVSQRYLEWGIAAGRRDGQINDAVFPLGYESSEPDEDDRSIMRARIAVRSGELIAVFAGSFGRTYDLATVIATARIFHECGETRIRFVLCGTGERAKEWALLANGLPNVMFTGLLSAGRLAAVFELSSVGLAAYAPFAPQGIPNKVIEYASAGLAIASSLEGESAELLDRSGCGFSYPAANPVALASSLGSILSNPAALSQMQRRSRQLYESDFSAGSVFGKMADHVERIATLVARADGKRI